VLSQLLKAGAEVSVIVRNPEKLSESIRSRVKIHQGSLKDAALVTQAFKGAKAAFWLSPSDYTDPDVEKSHKELANSVAAAVKENKVPYVVNLSSAGAHLEKAGPVSALNLVERGLNEAGAHLEKAGPVSALNLVERGLNEVAQNVVHLRPGFFMENYLQQVESIKRDGAFYSLLAGDKSYPLVATQDIGDVAAELLLKPEWKGQNIRGVHGSEDLTFDRAAEILGESIGKPVKHVLITPEQAYQSFLGIGSSPGFASALVEMYQALQKPGVITEARTPQTTTPTTLRQWSDAVLCPIVNGR
jgi:uncharacterized protein YbjT (DUF2867 family)